MLASSHTYQNSKEIHHCRSRYHHTIEYPTTVEVVLRCKGLPVLCSYFVYVLPKVDD